MGKRVKLSERSFRVRPWVICVLAVLGVLMLLASIFIPQSAPAASTESHPSVKMAVMETPSPVATTPSATPTLTATPEPVATTAPVDVPAPEQPPAPPVVVSSPVPAAEVPMRLIYPEANIDTATLSMDGRPRVIDPPIDSNSHWLNNYGLVGTASTDTVYIVAHSCGLGYPGCSPQTFPFNNLSTMAAIGQRITVMTAGGEAHYRVTSVFSYKKNSTPADKKGTWDQVPGRLVLMSCYTADLLGENVVVFAQLEK